MKILVLATFDGTNANVIRDFLFSFNAHSKHDYYYVFDCKILDRENDFSRFDVILIFWSLYLLGSDLSEEVREKIGRAAATKILFLQDEYRDVRRINRVMAQLGVRLMFTCVAPEDHETFYPPALIPSLEATYTVLPGYVPAYLESARIDGAAARPIEIGYRSRAVPHYLGDLGRDKSLIAERFTRIATEHGFRSDISILERDRIYGGRWLRFLGACRFMLGSPSGASVVDFTGEIRRNCELSLKREPGATYEDMKRRFFADVEGKVVIDTISPRIFEAAAFGCALVLHEGRYVGVLKPDVHYIGVKRDYSNIGDVIERMRDRRFCGALVGNAHRDLIMSGAYSYREFARWFDGLLAKHVPDPPSARPAPAGGFYLRNYVKYGQPIVPFRDRFVLLPSAILAGRLIGAALTTLFGARVQRSRVISRALQNPGDVFGKAWAAGRAVMTVPAFRRLLIRSLSAGKAPARPRLQELIEDILKLDILRRAGNGVLRSRQPFRISVDFDRDAGVLTFTSHHARDTRGSDVGRDGMSVRETITPQALASLIEGQVKAIVWDHSTLGLEVIYAVGRRWCTVGVGPGGVHGFGAFVEMWRRLPREVRGRLVTELFVWQRDGRPAERSR